MKFVICYHYYSGPAIEKVWLIHKRYITQFIQLNPGAEVYVYVYGDFPNDKTSGDGINFIQASKSIVKVNEFNTLAHLKSRSLSCDAIIYMHSKGSSGGADDKKILEWSELLVKHTLNTAFFFHKISSYGFNVAGINYSLGVFDHFQPPKKHFSGNFWVADSKYIQKLPEIELNKRYFRDRHHAEFWISASKDFSPFNWFSSGIDHYKTICNTTNIMGVTLGCITIDNVKNYDRYKEACEFMYEQYKNALPSSSLMKSLALLTFSLIPNNWSVAKRIHNSIFLRLGSRKSSYIYMPIADPKYQDH